MRLSGFGALAFVLFALFLELQAGEVVDVFAFGVSAPRGPSQSVDRLHYKLAEDLVQARSAASCPLLGLAARGIRLERSDRPVEQQDARDCLKATCLLCLR